MSRPLCHHSRRNSRVTLTFIPIFFLVLSSELYAKRQPCFTIFVSPYGRTHATGRQADPIGSLSQAQLAVRDRNTKNDVCVVLADGSYRLTEPLVFTSRDGGQGIHSVIWKSAAGAQPTISGGDRITGWRSFDALNNIYVASVPIGRNSRQLWVNDVLAERPSIEIDKNDVELTATGFLIKSEALLTKIARIKVPNRLELEMTGISEDRYSPVAGVKGNEVTMQQSAWNNNTWGYDTPNKPWNPETSRLFLVNALELMGQRHEWHRNQDQWFLNPDEGKLYFKPADDVDIATLNIVLPQMESLLSVSGTYDNPVKQLTFSGLRFSYTTWTAPSGNTGYPSQQSGAYLSEISPVRPLNAFETCGQGCPEFESMRERWNQMPAAIQISAARNIGFVRDSFTQLGQTAIGVGNDANANLSGIGLGTDQIHIERNRFAVLAAGAVMAGGVRRDAHHPSDPRMVNRNLLVADNIITNVANDYKDTAAILSTYVDGASIVHNDISDANYDAIDIGWGWGINDAGGNPNYGLNMKGYTYNPVYSLPTTLRDNTVAYNRIHGVKKWFIDSGAIYSLSSDPGAVIAANYVFDQGERTGIYLDEGSHFICLTNNVIATNGFWLSANTLNNHFALGVTAHNRAQENWHNSDKTKGRWAADVANTISEDRLVADSNWPQSAQRIIRNAGPEPDLPRTRSTVADRRRDVPTCTITSAMK